MSSISNDLLLEIFSRLPAKSIARFYCLSKLWDSMLHRPYFTELFLTRSSTRPPLLFAIQADKGYLYGEWSFFSLPQPQNPYEKSSSLAVSPDFQSKFPEHLSLKYYGYASGLICFRRILVEDQVHVICNPSTGRYAILPKRREAKSESFLGFDPIEKQFKLEEDPKSLNPFAFECRTPLSVEGICINGVLYYFARTDNDETSSVKIVCFDVRFEKFKFIDGESFYVACHTRLINYKGKLGVINWEADGIHDAIELCVWILEDVEKQEWSKRAYTFRDDKIVDLSIVNVVGMNLTGEIVLSTYYPYVKYLPPFYVFYFNPERNTLQRVISQGFGETLIVRKVFVDYVEDLNANDAKLLKSSIYDATSMEKKKKPTPHHREEVRERDMDRRYNEGVSREKKYREKDERDSREDEYAKRRRRSEETRDRERRAESGRNRDDPWSNKSISGGE
ncbi:unnamed protein product [Microthlaspi erraticum]|uniref:F-box domain-containing protein n=1 Tax=Microthlaspi erraticum TaxID=1685480 RepID=A0A6D2LMM0_9BRAS|nr:unnamed protein product [Microthlaspi erraticum]